MVGDFIGPSYQRIHEVDPQKILIFSSITWQIAVFENWANILSLLCFFLNCLSNWIVVTLKMDCHYEIMQKFRIVL